MSDQLGWPVGARRSAAAALIPVYSPGLDMALVTLDGEGVVTPGYLARKLKVGIQKANRIHQTLVADEAAVASCIGDR